MTTNFSILVQEWDARTPAEDINDWVVEKSRENPNLKFYPIDTRQTTYALAYSEQDITEEQAQRLYDICEEEKGQDEDYTK